ncbi:hypothetical protein [Peribacillus frigoritolerans]|uniref:hypothetical protein n=1 Tax=Peribacillus frigoritolerans TaxID=450367 RepID=UPI003D2DE735
MAINYPDTIKKYFSILERWGITIPRYSVEKEIYNKTIIYSEWYRSDFLFYFGYYRKDYEDLLIPVANLLAVRGRKVSFVYKDVKQANHKSLNQAIDKFYFDDISNKYKILSKSKIDFLNNYQPHLNKLYSNLKFNMSMKKRVNNFYLNLAKDKHLMLHLLQLTRPKAIIGIHNILTPGYVEAVNKFNKVGIPIINTLMQHGVFGFEKKHDFFGADYVFLWGKFHQDILKTLPGQLPSIITGNPKVEQKLNFYKIQPLQNNPVRIVYLFSTSKKKLDLFLQAKKYLKNVTVKFKLHPGISIEALKSYIIQGSISSNDIYHQNDIYTVIQDSDIVTGDLSTSQFEAAALGKLVIQIKSDGDHPAFLKFLTVSSAEEFISTCNNISQLGNKKEYLKKQEYIVKEIFHDIHGSTQRTADSLEKLVTTE